MIRTWKDGDQRITGPVQVALAYLLALHEQEVTLEDNARANARFLGLLDQIDARVDRLLAEWNTEEEPANE